MDTYDTFPIRAVHAGETDKSNTSHAEQKRSLMMQIIFKINCLAQKTLEDTECKITAI